MILIGWQHVTAGVGGWNIHLDLQDRMFLVGIHSLDVQERGGASGVLFNQTLTSVYLGPFSVTIERAVPAPTT